MGLAPGGRRRGRRTLGAGGRIVTPEQVLLLRRFGLGLGRRRGGLAAT